MSVNNFRVTLVDPFSFKQHFFLGKDGFVFFLLFFSNLFSFLEELISTDGLDLLVGIERQHFVQQIQGFHIRQGEYSRPGLFGFDLKIQIPSWNITSSSPDFATSNKPAKKKSIRPRDDFIDDWLSGQVNSIQFHSFSLAYLPAMFPSIRVPEKKWNFFEKFKRISEKFSKKFRKFSKKFRKFSKTFREFSKTFQKISKIQKKDSKNQKNL